MRVLSKCFVLRIRPELHEALKEEAERLHLRVSDIARVALARACEGQDVDREVVSNARTH